MDLNEKIRHLPPTAGVYLYKDADARVIYVGKAKNIRQRVRNYLLPERAADAKTGSLLREAADLDYIVVDNEREALALENNLIKQLKPRFNVLLRDDKTYPYIRLTSEPWPRVYVTRRIIRDGSEYFGPYFPASLAYRLVRFIHLYFKIPSCGIDLSRFHPKPCLEYHIHRCLGPCVEGLTDATTYQETVASVRLFLGGRHQELVRRLRERRDEAAAAERFEEAARYRDLLAVIEDADERQKMAEVEGEDADIFGLHRAEGRAAVNVFHRRHGRVVERRELFWEELPTERAGGEGEIAALAESGEALLVGALLKQLYLGQPYIPPSILVPCDFEDREELADALSGQRGRRVHIVIPERGPKRALLELAATNAEHSYRRRFRVSEPLDARLAEALGLAAPLRRIECFDISHFQGADTVASMVVWEDGEMRKSDYRRFLIRGVTGGDDFRAMEEVVGRRYRRLRESGITPPDLVLIDGGIGQLHAAQKAFATLGLAAPELVAIAKREEVLYRASAAPLRLARDSAALRCLEHIRDEAHRFAVAFHRRRRDRRQLRSPLAEVTGIGPGAVRRLLRQFGSVEGVRAASRAELAAVVHRRQTEALWTALHAGEPSAPEGAPAVASSPVAAASVPEPPL